MAVPAMILRRLYVKKSLKNTSEGVEFTLKNILADATINKPLEITIDNNPIPLEKVILVAENKTIQNTEISSEKPLDFSLNTSIIIRVEGLKLDPGQHKIAISGTTKEYGNIKFDIVDKVE